MTEILFYPLAAIAVVAALAAITRIGALASALWLALAFLAIAGIAATLAAGVLAAIFALVMAGAIVVLIVFVVLLVDPGPAGRRPRQVRFEKLLGAAAAGYLAAVMGVAIAIPPFVPAPASGPAYEAAGTLGEIVLARYAVPFELTGVLLLAATVAVVVIAKKPRASAPEPEEAMLA